MIGQDFPKMEWHFFGLDLLEPNAMIGDVILFALSVLLAFKLKKNFSAHPFYEYWRAFFLWFGWSFLLGGFGHLFYNYLGLWGKYPSWILGMVATYFLTKAMLSLWPQTKQKTYFERTALALLCLGVIIELNVFINVDLSIDQSKGLFIPTLISGIGLTFSLVYLGIHYQRTIHPNFKWLWIAALTLLPNAFIQSQKINMNPWFDRNDFSHVLLFISQILYFSSIRTTKNAPIFKA